MSVAVFDLDNTLLAGDSDFAWGEFLIAQGIVDGASYRRANDDYFAQYQAGTLDILAFLAFTLQPLTKLPADVLADLRERYMEAKIRPMITPAARALVQSHRTQGHTLVIATSTNSFLTAPIAAEFGVNHLLATEPEMQAGRFTGGITGIPCFRDGKVRRLKAWLEQRKQTLADSWCYSDSHNDLPLLELVTHPVAVNPDERLRSTANARGWKILKLP